MKRIGDWSFATVIVGLSVTLVFVHFYRQDNDPTRYENYEKIESGMSYSEVVKLLGCGPGTYRHGDRWVTICRDSQGTTWLPYVWEGESMRISIYFDHNGVSGKTCESIALENYIDRFRGWFHLDGPGTTFVSVGN